jgi:hypothetical protein
MRVIHMVSVVGYHSGVIWECDIPPYGLCLIFAANASLKVCVARTTGTGGAKLTPGVAIKYCFPAVDGASSRVVV